ncbi:MAG: hypothetical protein C4563_01175 [Desulfobulbus sp.]|nr:MAG: hypothetical protein C4563_01175 [Desulfobulbus sp.]
MIIAALFPARSDAAGDWKSEREQLDRVHTDGYFRIFYTLQGKNALTDPTDANANSIPDIVENITVQLHAADRLYREVFKLTDPLASKRYRDKVKSIDVHVLSSEYKGESGDGVIQYTYRVAGPAIRSQPALTITISNAIATGNLTPAHELIHSYQNGYTMFKNRWFTEGTARWVEYAFQAGTGPENRLPDNGHDLSLLLQKTYDAKYFWNRLFRLCSEGRGNLDLPEELREISYVGNKEKVITENDLFGADFFLKLLNNLDRYDDRAAADRGFAPFRWKEAAQKSPENNRYILMALKETILASPCSTHPEVGEFLDILAGYQQGKLPEPDLAPDLTDRIEVIGNPYAEVYREDDQIYARNIWDMVAYKGLLFIGGGNANNSGPAPNAGPVPIFSYDPQTGVFRQEGMVDDEEINSFTLLNDRLYLPGADATESHRYSNFYLRNDDGSWRKTRNIPGGLHTFAMTSFDGKLMAGISTREGAAVAISENNGQAWQVTQIGPRQRTYSLLTVAGNLYAMKQFMAARDPKKTTAADADQQYGVAQYIGNGLFAPRHDLTEAKIFPDMLLDPGKKKRITRSLQVGEKALYIGAYNFKSPFGFFLASSFGKEDVDVRRIKLPLAFTPRDFLVRGDNLYFLCTEKAGNGFVQKIITTTVQDIKNYQVLFQFSSTAFARSFEEIDGDFYFGLGSDVRSSRKWASEEIDPDTGKIIRISLNDAFAKKKNTEQPSL